MRHLLIGRGRGFAWASGLFLAFAVFLLCHVAALASSQYTFTIYVLSESSDEPWGHVFMKLSDGQHATTNGFYPAIHSLGWAALGGGKVKSDANTPWDVKRVWYISEAQYRTAQSLLAQWNAGNHTWWISNDCADFVEGFTKALGIHVNLPWTLTGRNRPALFEKALLADGGTRNPATLPQAQAQAVPAVAAPRPYIAPTPQPEQSGAITLHNNMSRTLALYLVETGARCSAAPSGSCSIRAPYGRYSISILGDSGERLDSGYISLHCSEASINEPSGSTQEC